MTARASLDRACAVLADARDIIVGRVDGGQTPTWCIDRRWSDFLLALDDAAVTHAEREGLDSLLERAEKAPRSLVVLVRAASAAAQLPSAFLPSARPAPVLHAASLRKGAQIEALLGAVVDRAAKASRIVDFGSGRGHLTRVAADTFEREAVGVERDHARVDRARELTHEGSTARFVVADAITAATLRSGDLALGLHACGALGDHLVTTAANVGAAVALVGCCPQKIGAEQREPLSPFADALALPREALGLANLSPGERGVERTREASLAGRLARGALLRLLRGRGVVVDPGEEMRGVNRRRALGPFDEFVARALAARGLPDATRAELDENLALARRDFAAARRHSLPRAALARLVEVAIALDRAAHLEARGYDVEVVELVPAAITPRNVALLAERVSRGRLA